MRTLKRTAAAALLTLGLCHGAARADVGDITLLGQILPSGAQFITDVWGYVDPVSQKEYAVVGDYLQGVYVIDVTDPTNPTVRADLTGLGAYGFDVKVWDHYIYTCSGGSSGSTSRVIDINDLDNPVVSAGFQSTHNFSVSPSGYLFAELIGLTVYDLNSTPMTPVELWDDGLGDAHDSSPVGNRLYDFRGGNFTKIWDITTPGTPVEIGVINDPNIQYHHSGYPTEDGNHLIICDELAAHPTPDITVWDISDLGNPSQVASLSDPNSTVHNIYVIGDLAYAAHYSAGFRVYDVSDPTSPSMLDEYDTSAFTGENFEGCFGVYPFTPSGNIYVTDWDNGLYIFSVEQVASAASDTPVIGMELGQNYPNPFNPATTIPFEIDRAASVRLSVYDARGALVRTLIDGFREAGTSQATWDGTDRTGAKASSGVYFARLDAAGETVTRRMVLLK